MPLRLRALPPGLKHQSLPQRDAVRQLHTRVTARVTVQDRRSAAPLVTFPLGGAPLGGLHWLRTSLVADFTGCGLPFLLDTLCVLSYTPLGTHSMPPTINITRTSR